MLMNPIQILPGRLGKVLVMGDFCGELPGVTTAAIGAQS